MLVVYRVNHTCVARAIRQRRDHLTCFTEIPSRAVQNAVLPFFENSLKCVLTALFDYHWTQILCEVEEQATCMPMSPSCRRRSNSDHRYKKKLLIKTRQKNSGTCSGNTNIAIILCCFTA